MSRFAHGVIAVADIEESCRFYRDGLGFEQISDDFIEADFGRLIGVNAKGARSVLLADSRDPSSTPVVELLDFGGAVRRPSAHAGPLCIGVFAVSLWANADEVQDRLKSNGFNPFVERAVVTAQGPAIEIGFARDPDGTYIELLPPYPVPSDTGGETLLRAGLDHTAMAVVDLDVSTRFYRDGLGLDFWDCGYTDVDFHRVVGAHTGVVKSVMLGAAEGDLMAPRIELVDFLHGVGLAPKTDTFHVGLFMHVVLADLDETEERLALHGPGIEVVREELDWRGSNVPVLFVRDPDDEHVAVLPIDV